MILGVVGLLILGALFVFKSLFLAAMVNGQPISRISIIKELERQQGKQLLDSLVTEALINQEAKKKNINVTQADIDSEIGKISENLKQQNQDLDQALQMQGMTRADLNSKIKTDLELQKLVGADIVVTDDEINDYLTKNKDSLPKDAKVEDLKPTVKQMLTQQKQRDKVQTWLNDVKAKASINYFLYN
jgi:foldase protein PrsA